MDFGDLLEEAIEKHIRNILNLFTDKCPHCKIAMTEELWTGCAALTCTNCRHGICLWCFADCGTNGNYSAYPHVERCSHNKNLRFGYRRRFIADDINDVTRTRNEFKRERVQAYIATILEATRVLVVSDERIIPELRMIGIN